MISPSCCRQSLRPFHPLQTFRPAFSTRHRSRLVRYAPRIDFRQLYNQVSVGFNTFSCWSPDPHYLFSNVIYIEGVWVSSCLGKARFPYQLETYLTNTNSINAPPTNNFLKHKPRKTLYLMRTCLVLTAGTPPKEATNPPRYPTYLTIRWPGPA
jgi:hypothetical protein